MHSEILEFRHPREFADREFGVVCFATAPDGLPLLTRVDRPPRAADLLYGARAALRMTSTDEQLVQTPLEGVVTQLDTLLRDHRYREITVADGDTSRVMVLWSPVRNLTGPTFLERVLLGAAPSPRAEPEPEIHRRVEATNAAAFAELEGDEEFAESRWRFVGEPLLALPLDGGKPVIVRESTNRYGWPVYTYLQTFLEESATPLQADRICHDRRGRPEELEPSETRRYLELQHDMPSYDWALSITRQRIAQLLAELADRVHEAHVDGRIHGDLKPANVLVTEDGPVPFDSLDLAEGSRSPAMTRGWAAPEQVLGRALSPATDQYPFGLMLLRLVGGVLFGEEATVTVPVGGQDLVQHSIHRDPGVYVDKQHGFVARDSTAKWIRFLEQCVRFDPAERHDTMKALGEQLRFLSGTLQGDLHVPLRFGNLVLAKPSNPDQWSGFVSNTDWSACWMVGGD